MEHESINLERDYNLKYFARKTPTVVLALSFIYFFLILAILSVVCLIKINLNINWIITISLISLSGLSLFHICATEMDWDKKASRITEIELSDIKISGNNLNTFHFHAEKLRSFVYFEKRGPYILYLLCKLIVCTFFLLSSLFSFIFLTFLNDLVFDRDFHVSSQSIIIFLLIVIICLLLKNNDKNP